MLQIFAAVNELDRATIKERQREGIASAKERGLKLGRPRLSFPEGWAEDYKRGAIGKVEGAALMKKHNISKPSFYALVKRWQNEQNLPTPKRWENGKPVLSFHQARGL